MFEFLNPQGLRSLESLRDASLAFTNRTLLSATWYQVTYTNLPGIEHMDMASSRHDETIRSIVETMHR